MQVVLDFEHMPGIAVDFIGVWFKFEAIVPALSINHREEKKGQKTAGGHMVLTALQHRKWLSLLH
jgi:hypothetical protein